MRAGHENLLTLGEIARHEAGHVIIAFHLQFEIARVTIRADGEAFGTTFIIHPIAPTREQARQIVLIVLGGYASDCYSQNVHRELSSDDFDRARRLLIAEKIATRESVDAMLADLAREAVGIIAERRRELETIYNLLVRRDELTGHEIAQIFDHHVN